jgi:cell division septation protein DedD
MKDKQISDEELFDELDTMYRRVADLERREAASEHDRSHYEYRQITDKATSTRGKVISFPEHRIRGISGKPLKKKPEQNKKRSYRLTIIATSFSLIMLAFILMITILKPITPPQRFKIGDTHQLTVATPSAPEKHPSESPQVQTDQEAMQNTQEEVEKAKSISQEIMKPDNPLPKNRYYAIQVGAFRNWKNVRDLIEVFKKKGLDAYWISMESKNMGTLYKVFVGHFMDTNEAAEFVKDKKILNNYPDSFIRDISSSEINH